MPAISNATYVPCLDIELDHFKANYYSNSMQERVLNNGRPPWYITKVSGLLPHEIKGFAEMHIKQRHLEPHIRGGRLKLRDATRHTKRGWDCYLISKLISIARRCALYVLL